MELKVIKFKNYGRTMTGGEDADDWKHMFYKRLQRLLKSIIKRLVTGKMKTGKH